jgi:hypothetical protein
MGEAGARIRNKQAREAEKARQAFLLTPQGIAAQGVTDETYGAQRAEYEAGAPQRKADKLAQKKRWQAAKKAIMKAKKPKDAGKGWRKDRTVYDWVDENGLKQFGTKEQKLEAPSYQNMIKQNEFYKNMDPRLKRELLRRNITTSAEHKHQREMLQRKVKELSKKVHTEAATDEDRAAYKAAIEEGIAFRETRTGIENYKGSRKYKEYNDQLPDWAADYVKRLDSDSGFAEAQAARPDERWMAPGLWERYNIRDIPGYKGMRKWGSSELAPEQWRVDDDAWNKKYGDKYGPNASASKPEEQPTKVEQSIIANPYEASAGTIDAPYNTAATRANSAGDSGDIGNKKAGDKVYNPKTTIRNKIQQRMVARRNQKRQNVLSRSKERIQ